MERELRAFAGFRWNLFIVFRILTLCGLCAAMEAQAQESLTGLWHGDVRVDSVSEPGSPTPEQPQATATAFEFPLLIHFDAAGEARLLKQVVLLWHEPRSPRESGRYLALTDDSLIDRHAGSGTAEGRRISSAAIDFPGTDLLMQGGGAVGERLTATIDLDANFPTHPFRHQYHPDHDNLEDKTRQALPPDRAEVYGIRRILTFFVEKSGPDLLQGRYDEVLSGLHKDDIWVSGSFTLRRVTTTAYLNR